MSRRFAAASALFAAPLALLSLAAVHANLLADTPPPTVVLLRGEAPDEVTTEAMARVKGELKAAGFDVAVVALSGDDARHDLETAGRELNPIAAFAIFVRPSGGRTAAAEIWVSDRIRQKTIIQNALLTDRNRGRGAEILAVRAVELLKASLADLWTPAAKATASASSSAPSAAAAAPPAREKAAAAVPTAGEKADKPRSPFASGIGIGIGAAILHSIGDTPTTWAPEALVSYGWPDGLSLRASFQGLGPSTTLSATAGTASLEEQLALIEVVKTWWPRSAFVPFLCAGAGAHHAHITGIANPPYQGHIYDPWSALASLGVGFGVPLFGPFSLLVQARAVGVWPPTVVQIAETDAGHIGPLSLLADGGLLEMLP
jgi:hypothetical protein